MKEEELKEVKKNYLEIVNGKVLDETWPNHIIYDIILNSRDGVQVPHVIAKNEKNPKDRECSKALDTWLKDNGY